MEASARLTGGAVEAPDLVELVRRPGPFLSMYLHTERHVENAAHRSEVRWRTVRNGLERQAVPEAVLDEIEAIVPQAHLEGDCLAVVADDEEILHVEHGTALGPNDEATWDALPRLLPIVRWRQSEPPYVVVLTDRTGADLFAFVRGLPDVIRDEVMGEHDVIRKVQPGGWSQRRFQQRAEDSWEQNAEQVAERVTRLVDAIRPEFVAVAGDVRAVQLLRGSLPERVDELVHPIDKEIPRKLEPEEPIPDDVWALVQQHVREAGERLLATFEEERGQHDKAVEGVDATARALSQGQVAVLLTTETEINRELSFGPEPSLVGSSPEELKELGVDSPEQGKACEVLVRAALGTGARLRVLDDDARIDDGVGALLRWSTS
jgi:Bacterial archaeo-eukaryotic release factor family 2